MHKLQQQQKDILVSCSKGMWGTEDFAKKEKYKEDRKEEEAEEEEKRTERHKNFESEDKRRRVIQMKERQQKPAKSRRRIRGSNQDYEDVKVINPRNSDKNIIRTTRMDSISKKLSALDLRRQELASELDKAQKAADYESFRKIGNSYLGTILESIDLYIELIKEISSEPVA